MRICHLITTISRGGAENQLLILAEEQISLGHSVVIVPLKSNLDLQEEFETLGVQVITNLHNRSFFSQVFLARKLSNFDVLHAHLPQAEIIGSLVRHKSYFISRHYGGSFHPKAPEYLSRVLSRFAIRNCKTVIAISDSVKEYLIFSEEVKDSGKIRVVKYGFNVQKYRDKTKTMQIQKKSVKTLMGTLARLSPEKDLTTLILGYSKYLEKCTESTSKLEIFGEGPERDKLSLLINQLGLRDTISLPGKTQNPAIAMESFDLFILTSLYEGFGMVLLEAMALGKPIICSRIPAAVEVLGDTGAAVYFQPGSPEDLTAKLLSFREMNKTKYFLEQETRLEMFNSRAMALEIDQCYYR